jgi:hypothetical protein
MSILRPALILTGLLLVSACGTTTRTYLPTAARPFEKSRILPFTGHGTIALLNDQPAAEPVLITKFSGNLWMANRKDWTDIAIEYLQKELADHGLAASGSGGKKLLLSVESVTTHVGAIKVKSTLVLRVTTGEGYTQRYIGENSSAVAALLPRQWDGVIMRALVEALKDPKIVAYLSE